jgi:predicted Zn-dependent protease
VTAVPRLSGDARRMIDQVVDLAGGAECEVLLRETIASHTRFARNEITTSGQTEDLALAVTVRRDGRAGTAGGSDLSPDGLRAAVARAEALRASAPPDPEAVDLLPPQQYPALDKYDAATAAARAADRVRGVRTALTIARKKSLLAAGYFETSTVHRAIGNSKGNFGHHRATECEFSVTMRTGDGTGSGWAGGLSPRLAGVDPRSLIRTAVRKGIAAAKPRDVPPGDYTVILEPAAVASLFQALRFGALSARAADEGRSVFSKAGGGSRIGDKMFHDSVTVRTDPFDPRVPGVPWSEGGRFAGNSLGLPSRRVAWIERGVLKTLHVDRFWAKATGAAPTPFPGSLVMEGGEATLEDLIASTEKGLLVTRFWYIRTVNPQTAQLTGLTRDGLFLIEDGKVAGPVVNLRFNESPAVVLQNVDGLTAAVPVGGMVVPAIKARDFTFTSKSDAV